MFFTSNLTECAGDNDAIYLFITFIIEGTIDKEIMDKIKTIKQKSTIYLNKNKKELIDNFNTEILCKLKKHHLSGKLSIKEDRIDIKRNIKYTILTTVTKIELEEIHTFYMRIINDKNYYPKYTKLLTDISSKIFFNMALIGFLEFPELSNMNILDSENFLDILCSKKVIFDDYCYINNKWIKYQTNLN